MLTKKDLIKQREQMQNDILCILDGLDQSVLDSVCQVIVDRVGILLNKLQGE